MSKFVYEVDRYSSKYVINKFEAEEQANGQMKVNRGRYVEHKRADNCNYSEEEAIKKYLEFCEKELKYAVRAYRRAMWLAGNHNIEVKSKI